MIDRKKVIKEAEEELEFLAQDEKHKLHMGIMMKLGWIYDALALLKEQDAEIENLKQTAQSMMEGICLLKEQKDLKQKMWNALYAEEDNLEKKFIGTEEHDDWFTVYRPWLQRGFEIAIKVIAEQDGM